MPKLQQPLWGTWFPAGFAYSKFSCSSHVRLTGKCGWELPGITRLAGPSDKRVSQDRALQLGRKMFERILSFAAGRPPGRGPQGSELLQRDLRLQPSMLDPLVPPW